MPLPAALNLVALHGKILRTDATGTPAVGTVSFRVEQTLRDTTDNVLLAPTTLTATLDATGAFTVSLPATDDPDVTPSGWTYVVTITTDALHDSFRIAVPAATVGTLELADIAPAVPPSTLVTYVLASTVGHVAGPAGPLDANGLVPTAQLPAGSGGGVNLGGDLGGTNNSPQVIGTHLAGPLPIAQGGTNAATASAARTALGLGGAAVLSVGTTAGTVAAGDDSRISGAAQKSANLSDLANASTARTNLGVPPATRAVSAGAGLTGGGDLSADRTIAWPGLPVSVGGVAKGTEPALNLIAGSGATISGADNPGASRVDVTISASGGGTASVHKSTGFITSGDVSATGASFAQIGTDLTITAATGDVLLLHPEILCLAGSDTQFEAATRVSAADVNWWSSGTGTSRWPGGLAGWYCQSGSLFMNGTGRYTVQAGDIVAGSVTVRFYARSTGAARTVKADTNYPTRWSLMNIGPDS